MITVKMLQQLLAHVPDDAQVSAYEGEDIGLRIIWKEGAPGEQYWWITARPFSEEDDQAEFWHDTQAS